MELRRFAVDEKRPPDGTAASDGAVDDAVSEENGLTEEDGGKDPTSDAAAAEKLPKFEVLMAGSIVGEHTPEPDRLEAPENKEVEADTATFGAAESNALKESGFVDPLVVLENTTGLSSEKEAVVEFGIDVGAGNGSADELLVAETAPAILKVAEDCETFLLLTMIEDAGFPDELIEDGDKPKQN